GDDLQRAVKIELVVDDLPANQFERNEGRVAFVQMKHGGRNAHRVERVDAADAEHDFLLDAHVVIAAIKLCGDRAIEVIVFRNVGVVEIKRDAPDLQLPDFRVDRAAGKVTPTIKCLPSLSSTSVIGRCEKFWLRLTASWMPSLLICCRK